MASVVTSIFETRIAFSSRVPASIILKLQDNLQIIEKIDLCLLALKLIDGFDTHSGWKSYS